MKRLFILIVGLSAFSHADSPITSTDFYNAYLDIPQVIEARENRHQGLTYDLAVFMLNKQTPIDQALAVINALSWDTEDQFNASLLEDYYIDYHELYDINVDLLETNISSKDKTLFAYAKAMDNYFDVTQALHHSNQSVEESADSFSIAMINNLIFTQQSEDWCSRFIHPALTVKHFQRNYDMRNNAINIIMDYMTLYKDDCPISVQRFFEG